MAKVHDGNVFAGIELALQLFHGDARNAELAQETPSGYVLVGEIGSQSRRKNHGEPATEGSGARRDALNFSAEHVAQSQETVGPEGRANGVKQQEAPSAHVKDASQRR